jgi:hypothetical protein
MTECMLPVPSSACLHIKPILSESGSSYGKKPVMANSLSLGTLVKRRFLLSPSPSAASMIISSYLSTILSIPLIGAVRALTSASCCLKTLSNLLQNTASSILRCGEHLRQCCHGLLLFSPSNLCISCC